MKRPKLLDVPVVGVAGSTLMDVCGDRPTDRFPGDCIVSRLLSDIELALLCVACLGRLLTLDTDELVDFRPRKPTPPEERRYIDDLGVKGRGLRLFLCPFGRCPVVSIFVMPLLVTGVRVAP